MYVRCTYGCMYVQYKLHLVHSRRVCTDLLGRIAVADDKTEWGRRVDIIGYVIDLDRERVSISRKNFLNKIYGFLLPLCHLRWLKDWHRGAVGMA